MTDIISRLFPAPPGRSAPVMTVHGALILSFEDEL